MNNKEYEKKENRKVLLGILSIMLIGIVYFYPAQRILAEIKYKEYAKQQGVTEEDIASIRYQKDYTQDGYYVDVVYKSDPKFRYQYHYFLIDGWKNGLKLHKMYCDVYDKWNCLLNNNAECKIRGVVYMPLE